jgi:hypothetical protein
MSDMVTASGIPEVNLDTGRMTVPQSGGEIRSVKELAGLGNFAADMAALEKELGAAPAQTDQGQPSPSAVTPAPVPVPPAVAPQPQAPPTTVQQPAITPAVVPPAAQVPVVEVPEKFRGPDGKLDEGKILKSYSELEREHSRKANALSQSQGQPAAQPQNQAPQGQPIPSNVAFSDFEKQVAQDMINVAASLGQQMPPAFALAQARIQVSLMEAKHKADTSATFVRVSELEQRLKEQDSQSELKALARDNPWIISPQAMDQLAKIRFEEKPWINHSPTPWADAVEILKGRGNPLTKGQNAPVIPNPTGGQQGQPLPATSAPKAATPVVLNTPEDVKAYLKTLNPEQEAEFWNKQGLKWDAPKKPSFGAAF